MMRVVRLLYRPVLAGGILFGFAWVAGNSLQRFAQRGTHASIAIGLRLPEAIIHGRDGDPQFLRSLLAPAGLSAVVFFGTECSSCVGEAVVWDRLQRQFADSLKIIAIATTPDVGFINAMQAEHDLRFTLVRSGKEVPRLVGARALPSIFAVDRAGRVVSEWAGSTATAQMVAWANARWPGRR